MHLPLISKKKVFYCDPFFNLYLQSIYRAISCSLVRYVHKVEPYIKLLGTAQRLDLLALLRKFPGIFLLILIGECYMSYIRRLGQ